MTQFENQPTNEQIARICHEANRVWCSYLGDDTQPSWEEAPDWQKTSAINGVAFHQDNPDAGDAASHESWLAEKMADGWIYGLDKDPKEKTHPCCCPFDELPKEQQFKDTLFRTIVHACM